MPIGAAVGFLRKTDEDIYYDATSNPITFVTDPLDANYKVATYSTAGSGYTFKTAATGTFKILESKVELLVVAAGGYGGHSNSTGLGYGGGGGGGGGAILNLAYAISSGQTYNITVGNIVANASGQNSVFNDQTAIGGGKGGLAQNTNGSTGGSGGGGAASTGVGGAPTSGQGYTGGNGDTGGSAGGGGGYSAVGQNGVDNATGGNGGAGLVSSISGASATYSDGGKGGYRNVLGPADGATAANFGGGGGGGTDDGFDTGLGGVAKRGIVIVRFKFQ